MLTRLALALSLLVPFAAQATEAVPSSPEQITLSFAPVVRQAAPAVVNIYAERVVNERISPFINDPFFSFLFEDQLGGKFSRQRMEQALGSGVIIKADGLVVTNRHVIENAQDIKIILTDRREYPAEIVTVDEKTDLAVLRAELKGASLPTLPLGDSDLMEAGDLVLAIGNPFGVGQSVSSGIVSATARTTSGINDYGYFIQTDAAINPGNSGGALVNMRGQLIGINTAIYSRSGGSIGIGFAIPSNLVRTVIEAGETGQRPQRAWLGIAAQEVTSDLAASLGLDRPQGVIVKSLQGGSPLAKAGIKVGDVITAVAGTPVDNPEALRFRTGTRQLGTQVALTVLRQDKTREVMVDLIAPPEDPPRQTLELKGRTPFSGATVMNLSPAVMDELGYDGPVEKGVIISEINPGSLARKLGFKPDDIILQVNAATITSVDDLANALNESDTRWRLSIRRGDQIIRTVVGG
jgi:Do/DeqQ family serine protease